MKIKLRNNFTQALVLSGLTLICSSIPNADAKQSGTILAQTSLETERSIELKRLTCRYLPSASVFGRTELFFGSLKPNGSQVSEAEFQAFLNREITPRFPDGLTLLTGLGQFKNSQGFIIRERSRQLILLYPIDRARDSNGKIEQIRKAYNSAFQQESVLRTDEISCVSF
ncbi:MAG: DUF3574 domain-containing protein [Cyanosarcina radialis HA8281-LM2]|jgi:hypothetical protein|nr:DUF3574 domain-containing protein [Cyanosarcina radialis HA8281-LM2]